jgi:hypothetical protein
MYAKVAFGNKIRIIDRIRVSVREQITQMAESIIVFWLKHQIGQLISTVSREAVTATEAGTLARKPAFINKIKQNLFINNDDAQLLRKLDIIMRKYKDADMSARKEAAARAAYAGDCAM